MSIEQLTFESLRTNRSVPAAGPAERRGRTRLKHQAIAIYRAMQAGPMTTSELSSMARQYNARISELRKWLRDSGMTIDMVERRPDGNNVFALRQFSGSRYQAELMARQKRISHGVKRDYSATPEGMPSARGHRGHREIVINQK